MLDLLRESLPGNFTNRFLSSSASYRRIHQRDWSSDSSSSGVLSPVESHSSRRGHRRTLSLFSLSTHKAICSTAVIVLLTFVLLWSFKPSSRVQVAEVDRVEERPIAIGKSEDRDGREVFWWEQFPRLHGFYRGRENIVPFSQYVPEQRTAFSSSEPAPHGEPDLFPLQTALPSGFQKCYLDEKEEVPPPTISAYAGLPQGMPEPLFGSHEELGLNDRVCYDRVNRLAPYGLRSFKDGDNEGLDQVVETDWTNVKWDRAQQRCHEKNAELIQSRTCLLIRTWSTFSYSEHHIAMLRALVSELSLASGGQYTVHFLIHVQDDTIPIWTSREAYDQVLRDSLPEEFQGMGTLWSVGQMKEIYPPPFPDSIVNFSGGDIYEAYRSLHFPLQYFASRHPEYDYYWQWEMDIRVTGHYHELLQQVTNWAEKQPRDYTWERSSKFFIPTLYDYSYLNYSESIVDETRKTKKPPVSGPQLPLSRLLDIPEQRLPYDADEITDLITFNPMFDPTRTRWAFHDDITGYNVGEDGRPPTRAALITASRVSRRLLVLMHEETLHNKHTMFPEMFPASIALHYGLKAVYAPLPVYFDRNWPSVHANEIFNNAPLSKESRHLGMDHGDGYFHGKGGSVFGPGEHVFRGASYYSNAGFAGYLWRRWLGNENANDEITWESHGGPGGGRMCLPMMVLHPIKFE